MTFPFPSPPPEEPARAAALGGAFSDDLRRQLLARRIVLVHGTLEDARTAEAAATLMMLDASGDDRIVLRLTGADGPIAQGLVLMDVIGVLGVPVDVLAAGTVAGGAVGVLAACRHRSLAAHARLHLREPDGTVTGRAVDIERALAAEASQRDRFYAQIAACTGRPQAVVEDGWRASLYLEPADAVALGYADEVELSAPNRAEGGTPG